MSNSNYINVHVTPKSGRDCLCGLEPDINGKPLLKVKVKAIPDKGKANESVCKLIAKNAKIAKNSVTVCSGSKSRFKRLKIDCSEDYFNNWIKNLL